MAMNTSMKAYESEVMLGLTSFKILTIFIVCMNIFGCVIDKIAGYKTRLFAKLNGKAGEVLELGIGTGPNLKYYSGAGGFAPGIHVIGVDPNAKMEKYAKEAAITAGMLLENFDFRIAV